MLVQRSQVSELPVAEIALIATSVPGGGGGLGGDDGLRGGEEVLGDQPVAVLGLDEAVEALTGDSGSTGGGFEVDGHCRGGCKEAGATGALDGVWIVLFVC